MGVSLLVTLILASLGCAHGGVQQIATESLKDRLLLKMNKNMDDCPGFFIKVMI